MYKLPTSQQQTSQLMYGFEESVVIRRQEVTNHETEKGKFGFGDQEKKPYGLGYTLTLKRNKEQ